MADLPRVPPESDYSYQSEAGFDNSGKSGEARDDGKDAVFAEILETLQENNSLLGEVEENLEEIEENTESDETASEKRKRRVKEENTDKKGMFSSALGGLGAGIKGVGGVLNKANPFQEGGLGTKMSILLISGVLFAISKFGDKLVKPLAEVLKMIDGEGGVLDKLKDTELFKSAMETFEKFKERAKTIGEDVAKLLEAVTTVGGFIKGAYDSVMAYINSFDTRGSGPRNEYGDGKLDMFELQNLKNDLVDKAKNLVLSLIDTIWASTNKYMIAAFAVGGVANLLISGYVLRIIALRAAAAATAATLAAAGVNPNDNKNNRTSDKKDNAKKNSLIKRVVSRTASAFTIGSAATASSIGGTASVANLAKDMRLNSANRVIYTKTGQYVAGYGLSHLAKYPGLIKIAQRAPFLAPILGGYDAIKLFSDPNATHDDKAVGLGRIFGEVGGAALFAKIGGALGTMALPGWGTALGAITGALGGYFAGGHIGEQLARFMLGDKPLMGEYGNQNIGSELNPTEVVENLPIQSMSASSSGDTRSNMEIRNTSTLGRTASQLDSSLMNRNSDLAIAAYEADNAKKLSNATPLPGGRDTAPTTMPIVVDQSETKTFNSHYSSSLGSTNFFATVRMLEGAINAEAISF
jgi:hypothetical protein